MFYFFHHRHRYIPNITKYTTNEINFSTQSTIPGKPNNPAIIGLKTNPTAMITVGVNGFPKANAPTIDVNSPSVEYIGAF